MPVIIATAIRATLQALLSLGIFKIAEEVILPWINSTIAKIAAHFGVPDEEATDMMANEWLLFAESVGVGALALKAKIPTKISERLGFTSKGFSMRKLKGAKAMSVAPGAAKAVSSAAANAAIAEKIIPFLATKAKVSVGVVSAVFKAIGAFVGLTSLASLAITQWIDFGNWNSGAYQGTFNKIFSIFGLKPDANWANPKVVSKEIFDKIYETYRLEGAVAIIDPYKGQTVTFTQANMVDLIDRVAAELMLKEGSASAKKVIGATQLMIRFTAEAKKKANSEAGSFAGDFTLSDSLLSGDRAPSSSLQIKVFSGLIQNGRLGEKIEFSPRPDDIIESVEELRIAAQNNLVPFLSTIYGRMNYEVKVVASVLDKDGVRRAGGYQTIVTGYKKDGTQKTRTIINKWAVVRIYVTTKRGARTLLDEIILGPIDSVKFQVGQKEIEQVNISMQQSVSTSNVQEINTIATNQPISVTPLAPAQQPTTSNQPITSDASEAPGAPAGSDDRARFIHRLRTGRLEDYIAEKALQDAFMQANFGTNPPQGGWPLTLRYWQTGYRDFQEDRAFAFKELDNKPDFLNNMFSRFGEAVLRGAPPVQTAGSAAAGAPLTARALPPQCSATNLSEWYSLAGQKLPSIAERGAMFETQGLGSKQLYVGTSEQNSRLLAALKAVECRL